MNKIRRFRYAYYHLKLPIKQAANQNRSVLARISHHPRLLITYTALFISYSIVPSSLPTVMPSSFLMTLIRLVPSLR